MFLTPRTIYNKRLEQGELKPDFIQRRVVEGLHDLHQDVIELHSHEKKSWLSRILNRDSNLYTGNGLYIHGGVGRGKSMLMDMFFECLPGDLSRRRVHFHQFMIDVHDFIHSRTGKDGKRIGADKALPELAQRIFERSRILCFDEFHVTDITDAMILGRLFTALFEKGVVIVATSNWEPDKLYEGGLKRDRFLPFIDLLKKSMRVMHLDSPIDYRALFLMEEGSYFWPLGETTHTKMTALFGQLTNYEMPREEYLEVKGRMILVEAAVDGVARFTFSQLCESPLGPEDYITIAKAYTTIFLEGVPKMGYDRRNEAKRFISLIDAVYENKTQLIISADVLPHSLYCGDDHSYEFERTISRLKEMQSQDYLEKA